MISAVVLAAGVSQRMGQPKPLFKLGRKTILQHVLANLRASRVDEIVVVLGHRAQAVAPSLKGTGCKIVVNPDYARGMSSSIRRGLSAVHPRAQAVLIALGDQPYIPAQVIDRFLSAYSRGDYQIVVPTYGGQRGHPVIIGRRYWPELRALKGDVGGRDILLGHAGDVLEVEVSVPGVLADIDRPGDVREAFLGKEDPGHDAGDP
jgi:molybdenum cofactor cytidylyltransferase